MVEEKSRDDDQEQMEVDEPDDPEGGIRIGDIYIPPPPLPACTMNVTGPRLMIWQIENINFKSYAGKQVLGPFHKNFTAIVGPNGSGKSNVIDSMLFVFGYRAQKIRSKKVGVLIHNSDTHRNVEKCTVSVHFQMIKDIDEDDYEVVPDSQFFVSRTAHRDNTSFYCINDRKVQFKEVSKMLRSYGIDLDHNRFLILQGEVEQIAMMKPKAQGEHDTGMLEFLEDIIGTNRFKEPIKQLAAQVEELNEIRVEKLNRVKVVEKEKDDIEAAKNEAVEFIKLENEIALKENTLYQVHRHEAQINLEEIDATRQKIMDQLKDVISKLDELKAKANEKEKEYNKFHEKYKKCVNAVEESSEQYRVLERQDLQLREKYSHCKTKDVKLVKDLEKEEQNLQNFQGQPEKYECEIQELMAKKEKLEKDKIIEEKKLAEVMASLQQETKGYQEEKDKYEAQLIDLKKTVNETKSVMDIAQSELDIYVSNEKNEQNRLKDMMLNLEKCVKDKQDKERLMKEAKKRIPETETNLKNCRVKLSGVVQKEEETSSELKSKRQKLEDARSAMFANRNRGQVLGALMKQKASGDLTGVFGRLGDLGAIDEKYDVAISTACGPLDNIVTDTMSTAQKCVEFLKKNNVGYATFIALDKMDRWWHYIRDKTPKPENVPRLFDLVKVNDERVLPAFYFALRETLVADNLDQATRIGLQGRTRHRVVTLKGELIDSSGTMSGGGGRVSKGRMGQSVVANDINPHEVDNMVRQLDEMTKLASDLREMKSGLEDKIAEMQKELSILGHSLKKYEMEHQSLNEMESALICQIQEQKLKVKSAAPDKAKVASMEKNVEKAKKGYEKAAEASSKIEAKVQKIHSLIMEITEGKVTSAQEKLDSLNNRIDGISSSITKSTVAIKTAKRNIKKSEDKVKSLKQEIVENANLKEKLHHELDEQVVKAEDILKQKKSAMKEKDLCEVQKQEMLKEINSIKAEENKLNSDNIEVKNKADVCATKVKEYQSKIKALNHQISKLKIQDFDDKSTQSLPSLSVEEIEEVNVENVQYEMTVLQQKLAGMKPNMAAIAEYRKKETQYLKKVAELDEVTSKRDSQRRYHDELRKQRSNEFMKGYSIISAKLKEMYQMITLGGDAEFELCDTLDPFEGIQFSVRPPKKSWKHISNLSGGEKTLSSLALVFALHYYKPTPFYVMDEIDAALDFKNVSIVGNYIKERTKNAQFIIISLRNNMFELCDRLVGIYKTYNCTKSVTVNPASFGENAGESQQNLDE